MRDGIAQLPAIERRTSRVGRGSGTGRLLGTLCRCTRNESYGQGVGRGSPSKASTEIQHGLQSHGEEVLVEVDRHGRQVGTVEV